MTSSAVNQLSRNKIEQLLAAVGARAQEDAEQDIQAGEFDWKQPRYFNLEQLDKIREFAREAAVRCTDGFSRLYQDECSVTIVSTEQRFPDALTHEQQPQNYYIPFTADSSNACGLLKIPGPSALSWTGLVLGCTDQGDPARQLSKLEESFLADIAADILRAFSDIDGHTFVPAGEILNEAAGIQLHGSDELLEIEWEVKKAQSSDTPAKASFVICCDRLEAVTGKSESRQEELSPARIREALMQHLNHLSVPIRMELGSTRLLFKDVMELAANDIIVLDKKASEPVTIKVDNRPLFCGRPAQSGGHYAAVIL